MLIKNIRWLWTLGTGVGAAAGAQVAISVFPSASFGLNPIGQFGWHLVGFAFSIGALFALSQWALLRFVLHYHCRQNGRALVLWIPLTTIGIAITVMPIWWAPAVGLVLFPVMVVPYVLPGLILLGLAQWFLLSRIISARWTWTPRTVGGGLIGAVFGLSFALIVQSGLSMFDLYALETSWAFVTGVGIAVFQVNVLDNELNGDPDQNKLNWENVFAHVNANEMERD